MINKSDLTIKLNHVILIDGFQKMSMGKLASAIDVSRATLYSYFENKEEIVQAVVARYLQFISDRPIPNTFTPDSFATVWLNSLLLMGSTTDRFNNDLQHGYPDLAYQLRAAEHEYFQRLLSYVEQAQQEDFIEPTYDPNFALFQANSLTQSIIQQVRSKAITLDLAERYLKDGIDFSFAGLLTSTAKEHFDIQTIKPFEAVILSEFRKTYSLIESEQ
ncbi:MAG: TetR/AcrR family transcriptional regulator [Furfurilactobacillus sp.]|jgi:AcrR family transcriptional regulator|uniref:TetR/AcrR family transcriptional regulator n=1 Tax=Furfurilactobacillus milii TaxID=2888272 RepID=A0ABT6D790_9LACO|nr:MULTISPECIES: TetR/AcrR family transcriptional regulator [Furfurilactobacillus]QLE66535.1 hypothetical protein LROSL2_1185 [Furfurilactobacillus rossiae]MCF6159988.1 TetR/AcrR family transcriptional regulator [Furfurilactobacillus milii]MCF6162463.1 TetR/AcrR family transcriptional regulator [Furfurilactobacillus milii]MCF6419366.1 TetR/AcrR family transcriptional regulator [Furfurilactobacillus milii]MCH4010758.1 TetR/AcrR family transcriptional regulator [Furfurilactobacillus sp.]